jgi:hypothetical protein
MCDELVSAQYSGPCDQHGAREPEQICETFQFTK